MPDPSPDDAVRARTSGRGCLGRGCALGCASVVLFPLLVVAIAAMAVRAGGDSYLGIKVQALRERHAVLNLALNAAEMLGMRQASDSAAGERERAIDRRTSDKSAVPTDLPVLSTAVDETYNVGPNGVLAFQRVPGPAMPVVQHFRTAMRTNGWQRVQDKAQAGTTVLIWKKAGRTCKIEVVERERVTEVWLRSQSRRTG